MPIRNKKKSGFDKQQNIILEKSHPPQKPQVVFCSHISALSSSKYKILQATITKIATVPKVYKKLSILLLYRFFRKMWG